jgi:amidohydrolase
MAQQHMGTDIIDDLLPDLVALRRDLHANPELAFEERRTAGIVAAALRLLGLEVHEGLAGTGVVGTLRNGRSSRTVGLRADMDALPIAEQSRLGHASRIAGVHHGCGHDGHTAMLLGAARQLARTRRFDGTVHFIFQPAEEGRGGARVMVEEGLFERFPCDAVYALHNWPDLPLGHAQTRTGPIMAAADRFDIVLRGRGGHAAQPHRTPDVLLAASQLVGQLNTIVARRIDPAESAVLSVTRISGGSSHNVLPAEASITGTVRSFDAQVQDRIEAALRDAAAGIALAHGVEADVSYHRYYPATVNSEGGAARAASRRSRGPGGVGAAAGVHLRGLRVHAAPAARRLPLARPGWRRTPAAPPLLRLQRRRAAARRALVLRGGRAGAGRVGLSRAQTARSGNSFSIGQCVFTNGDLMTM